MNEEISPLQDPSDAMEPSIEATPVEAPPERAAPQARRRVSLPAWRPSFRAESLTGDRGRTAAIAIMALIVLVGAFLRFSNANWDHHIGDRTNENRNYNERFLGHLHPDERFLTQITIDTKAPDSDWWNPKFYVDYFDTDTSTLNPYNIDKGNDQKQTTFVYGTLPVFATKFVASHAATPYKTLERVGLGDPVNAVLDTVSGGRIGLPTHQFQDYDTYTLAGRWLSAMTDLLTIFLVFLLARQLTDKRSVGLLAAGLYAFAPFALQNAHYYIVDPYVAFFATFALLFAVRAAQSGGYRNFVLAGIGAGLATASKTTAVALIPVVMLSVGVFAWPGIKPFLAPLWAGDTPEYASHRDGHKLDRSVGILILGTLAALLAAFIAYRIAMPYAFKTPSFLDLLDWRFGKLGPFPTLYPDIMNGQWLADQSAQQRLLSGDAAFPPNVQWIGRSKWIWPLQQMISWGMGPALGITAWIGVGFAAVYAWRKRIGAWLVPLAWVLGYFAFMGAQYSLYMRYFLPLYPVLSVFAAFVLYQTWHWASSDEPFAALGKLGERLSPLKPALPVLARAGVVTVAVFTVLAGLAFYNIYRAPVSRAAASCWVYQNVPEGAVIGHEHWDDTVPYGQPDPNCGGASYGEVTFENFGTDTPERVTQLLADIDAIDYYIPASARLSSNIMRVPAVWPVTALWYETLEKNPESIGFREVAKFNRVPSIFGREFDDTDAEESWTVYDHPTVVVYEKTDDYDSNTVRKVLGADAFVSGCQTLPGNAAQNCLLYTPEVLARQSAAGTWTDTFDPGSLPNRFPAFFFLLVMELAAFALIPLAIVGFRGLPDRGYLLTKPLGIIGLAYLVYLPSGFGWVDFTRGTIAGMLAIMLLIGVLTFYAWRDEVVGWFREHWRFALGCEAIFLAMFIFSYWLRLQNPDLYHPFNGGEKPMDFAYFNGVLRTTDLTQGPVDPWYAGGYLNYYWWGFFVGATPIKLLGIVPEVAYNLVVPMFYSLAAAATFSVGFNLTESTRQLMRRGLGGRKISAGGPIMAGLLAVFLVLIAGNLRAVGVLHDNFAGVSPWSPDIPIIGGIIVIFGGFWEAAFGDASFRQLVYDYDWWAPSRALTILPNQQNTVLPITEFPFWTFLFADLHAHLMAIPFAMTATGVGLGAVMNFTRLNATFSDATKRRSREIASWGMVLTLALLVGALRWINSWDYPPFLLIGFAALLLGERAKEGRFTLQAITMGVVKTGAMGLLSYLLFTVVAKNYSQSYSSVHRADQTTDLSDYFTHFGVLLFFMSGFILFQLNRVITRTGFIRMIFFGRARRRKPLETAPVMAALIVAGGLIVLAFTFGRVGVVGLSLVGLIALVLLAAHEVRSRAPTAPVMLFVYAMMALGFGLSGGVEIITLDGDVGRMNTVFKFYLHVWMMWGVVGAFSVWYIFGVMRPQEAFLRRAGEINAIFVRAPRYAFAAVAVVMLVLTLVYPYFGTRARIHNRFDPSLGSSNDGLAWMDSDHISVAGKDNKYIVEYEATGVTGEHEVRYTRDAINWVRQNVPGTPITIEAVGPSYRSLGSRFAINTGLPTVVGWGFHQSQQRVKFNATLQPRQADVLEFYSTEDAGRASEILEKYNVQWVFVGDEEEFNYGKDGLAKFDDGLNGTLELRYENPAIRIFSVIPDDELAAESATR